MALSPLEVELCARIAAHGPMTVAEYMALCLAHPQYGYYVTRDPLGARGDFITAPEVSQMFGELIGAWAATIWQQMGQPKHIRLVELGPGRGTLMSDALRAAKVLPGFAAAISVHLVEVSPVLKARQREVLGAAQPVAWHASLDEVPDGPAIVIANEFFDALPVHQAVKTPAGWCERRVATRQGTWAFVSSPEPLEGFAARLPGSAHDAPDGAIFEWRDDDMAAALGRRLAQQGGAALVIDYGHAESAVGDTLQAIGRHAFADPLASPGALDLTAHVDFAGLKRAALSAGAAAFGPITQAELLQRLGIAARAAKLKAHATPDAAARIDAALARLTGTGESEMGALFKAVAIAHPALGAPAAFDL